MPEFITQRWEGNPGAHGGRRSRASFAYKAYIPDSVARLDLPLSGPQSLIVSDAEGEIRSLNAGEKTGGLEAVGALLLRAESIASSKIEGLELSQRSLARALFDPAAARGTARLVAGNVRAMQAAISIGDQERLLRVDDIVSIHRNLLQDTEDHEIAGVIRDRQNWIGGRLNSPIDAEFIPPPPDHVEGLLEDLTQFMNRDDLPAVVQAGIAHAQFETIHPFLDGNGRVGRCLIHVILRRRGLAPRVVPPVSIVLATNAKAYIAGLNAVRSGEIGEWTRWFAYSCRLAAIESNQLGEGLARLTDDWRERAGRPRKGSSADKLLTRLPAHPVVSVATAHDAIGGSTEAVRVAVNSLETAGILRQITAGHYARAWAADDLFDVLNEYEHGLATPTRSDQRGRASPRS